MSGGTFREWLAARVGDGDGLVSRRELARRLAEKPHSGDVESHRSSLRRIIRGERVASQPTRDAIQEALGDFSAPSLSDEDEPLTREMVVAELDRLQRNARRLKNALASGRFA